LQDIVEVFLRCRGNIKDVERDDVDGHFAYPAIIAGSDGLFHLVYNNRRRNMRYCRFDSDWITQS
jgi:predicted neuraminidase